jgi:hypothetical protein
MNIVLSPNPDAPQPRDHLPFKESLLLLVEGRDDQALFAAIATLLAADEDVVDLQIRDMNGHTDWHKRMAQIAKDEYFRKNVRAVGLVQDADTDPVAARTRCEEALRKSELPTSQALRTGIFIVPSALRPGAVEDLCLDSISGTPRLDRAMEYIDGLPDAGLPQVKHRDKAVLQAYLAAKPNLCKTLWLALRRGCFDMSHEAFADPREFLRSLIPS